MWQNVKKNESGKGLGSIILVTSQFEIISK